MFSSRKPPPPGVAATSDLSVAVVSHQSNQDHEMVRLLPVEERGQYHVLVESIVTDIDQSVKHSSLAEFVKHITRVHGFITRGNPGDPLRGIVCGVEFGRGFILVNTDRLKRVLYRSKSCMNGCWQRLGYDVMRPSHDIVCLFTKLLPNVNPEFFALKQWCIRLVGEDSRVKFASNLPDGIANAFEAERIPNQKIGGPAGKTLADIARENGLNANLWDVKSLLNPRPFQFP
jgi:hypothetical protein